MIQAANLCFAAGQVAYKRLDLGSTQNQIQQFAAFFAGASLVSGLGVLLFGNHQMLPTTPLQWGILLWLGIVASGLGYLGWNLASKWVNTGQLAAMNNALIPAGILVNVLFWQHDTDWLRWLLGASLIVIAVILASRQQRNLSR